MTQDASGRTIYLVDEDASFRTSTRELLETSLRYAVHEFGKLTDAIERLRERGGGRGALRDVCLLTSVDRESIELSKPASRSHVMDPGAVAWLHQHSVPVVYMSLHIGSMTAGETIDLAFMAAKEGAVGFIQKPFGEDELATNLAKGFAPEDAIVAAQRERLQALQQLQQRLSPRELEVYREMVLGKTTKEIARDMNASAATGKKISPKTVEHYRKTVLQKMGCTTTAALIALDANISRKETAARLGAAAARHTSDRLTALGE